MEHGSVNLYGIEEQWAQRNSGHRKTVDTEEQGTQRNSEHRVTVGTEAQWVQGVPVEVNEGLLRYSC